MEGSSGAHAARKQESQLLREYYTENDFLLSAEGILKLVSVAVCVAAAALYLGSGGGCARAAGLAASAAALALAAAAAQLLLYAGAALHAPLYAPQLWLFLDIIVSTVMGILLLVMAILNLTFCELNTVVAYMHAPLGALAALATLAGVGRTFCGVTRRWDAAWPAREPRRPTPREQDA